MEEAGFSPSLALAGVWPLQPSSRCDAAEPLATISVDASLVPAGLLQHTGGCERVSPWHSGSCWAFDILRGYVFLS